MNIVWRFIEDLVGKGFSLKVLAQFFYYFSLTLVPMALPLAVLLASLITFGNFGERLELLAMKTAGISLLRIMRPIIIFSAILAGVSFYFQNVTVPNVTQKLYALIYSMQQKSPELEIPEGVFYDQISGFNLYVKQKNADTGTLYGITIYDLSKGFEEIRVIASDSGRLETTADKKHLYLHLYHGEQFENMQAQRVNRRNNPYRREIFREKHILIDFNSDFNMVDDGIMSSQAASKNLAQIRQTIDSLSARQDSLGKGNYNEFKANAMYIYHLSESDSSALTQSGLTQINLDSAYAVLPRADQLSITNKVQSAIVNQKSALSIRGASMFTGDRLIRKHWIEWMKKFSQSTSILIFFFIGAPLGAIIRKGGLGVPVIVSVFTFILYYISSVSGEKMFREGEWSIIGCWLSTFILLPLSVFFTAKANRDSTVFQWDVYKEFFIHWFGGRVGRHMIRKEVIINDPDKELCVKLIDELRSKSGEVVGAALLKRYPNYSTLFFKGVSKEGIESFNSKLENLVEELANSKDRVILGLLNNLPIIPTYGIESPFEKRLTNRIVGLLFPIGLLFQLRAWLFGRKIHSQIVQCEKVLGQMSNYIRSNSK